MEKYELNIEKKKVGSVHKPVRMIGYVLGSISMLMMFSIILLIPGIIVFIFAIILTLSGTKTYDVNCQECDHQFKTMEKFLNIECPKCKAFHIINWSENTDDEDKAA